MSSAEPNPGADFARMLAGTQSEPVEPPDADQSDDDGEPEHNPMAELFSTAKVARDRVLVELLHPPARKDDAA